MTIATGPSFMTVIAKLTITGQYRSGLGLTHLANCSGYAHIYYHGTLLVGSAMMALHVLDQYDPHIVDLIIRSTD